MAIEIQSNYYTGTLVPDLLKMIMASRMPLIFYY
jgi:hypothetical protein